MVRLVISLLALSSSLFLPCSVSAEEMRIVAVVNNEPITQADLDRAFLPVYLQMQSMYGPEEVAQKSTEIKQQVLQQLVEERLMLQEARNPQPVEVSKGKIGTPQPITASDQEVEEMLSETKAKFQNAEELTEALREQGMTLEDLKSRFRDQIMIQKLISRQIRSRIAVSPAEVTAYYEQHSKEFEVPAAVQGAVILIKPKESFDVNQAHELAQHLRQQILQGSDFYELAKRYSDGPNPKMGGRIGYLEKGKSLKEIDEALFSLKEGEISPVIKTSSGFNIFRIESVRPARAAELQEVKDRIQNHLFQEKTGARYKEWIARLKAGAYISIQ